MKQRDKRRARRILEQAREARDLARKSAIAWNTPFGVLCLKDASNAPHDFEPIVSFIGWYSNTRDNHVIRCCNCDARIAEVFPDFDGIL